MRGCRHARRWSERSLDGTLALHDGFRLEAHLAECEACRSLHAAAAVLEEALARQPEPPPGRVDVERAVRAVGAALDAAPDEPARRVVGRTAVALAAAAGLALLAAHWSARADGVPAAPEVVRAGPPIAPPSPAPQPGPELGEEAPLDEARLARARAEVAAALLDTLGDVPIGASRAEVESAARSFDGHTRSLREGRWPVTSIAAGLAERAEPRVARAAIRMLGVRGSRIEMHALRAALHRRELKLDAVSALGDAGEQGLAGLADALRDPELFGDACANVVRVGGAAAAALLADTAARGGSGAEDALAALASLGPASVAPLLSLASSGIIGDGELADLVQAAPGGAAALDELARSGALEPAGALAAARALQPAPLLPWLVVRCEQEEYRPAALDALSRYVGTAGAAALLAVARLDEVPLDELELAAARMVAADGSAFQELVGELLEGGRPDEAVGLAELAGLAARPEGLPALLAVAAEPAVDEASRLWCASAARELAEPEHIPLFEDGYALCDAADRRLAATYLLAVHDLGGAEAAVALAGPSSSRAAGRIRVLVERAVRDPRSATLLQLAREVEALLPSGDRSPRSTRSKRFSR